MRIIYISFFPWLESPVNARIIISFLRISLNPTDVVSKIIKNLKVRGNPLQKSELYLIDKSIIDQGIVNEKIKVFDFYDKKKKIPHLSLYFFIQKYPKPQNWLYYNFFVATSWNTLNTKNGKYSTLELGGKFSNSHARYIANSCTHFNAMMKILNKGSEEFKNDIESSNYKSTSLDILRKIGKQPQEIWETSAIVRQIQFKIDGKIDYLHQGENKIISIYEEMASKEAAKTGFKSYDELTKFYDQVIDEQVEYLKNKDEFGLRRAHAFLKIMQLIAIERGPRAFDSVIRGLKSGNAIEEDEAYSIMSSIKKSPELDEFADVEGID